MIPKDVPSSKPTPYAPLWSPTSMSPIEKAEISRRNGQLSEGPTSAEGKRIVSRNALKHGLSSETIAVKSEEQAAYALRLQSWVAQLTPSGLIELMLVERICRNSWKLEKIAEREDELLDLRLAMTDDDETAAEIERELRLLARYEQAAERHFHKALNMLLKLRAKPELLAIPTPAPAAAPKPAPIPAPRREPLVIPPAPNKPSFFGDLNPILNVTAARPPIVNGKTHRAGV